MRYIAGRFFIIAQKRNDSYMSVTTHGYMMIARALHDTLQLWGNVTANCNHVKAKVSNNRVSVFRKPMSGYEYFLCVSWHKSWLCQVYVSKPNKCSHSRTPINLNKKLSNPFPSHSLSLFKRNTKTHLIIVYPARKPSLNLLDIL